MYMGGKLNAKDLLWDWDESQKINLKDPPLLRLISEVKHPVSTCVTEMTPRTRRIPLPHDWDEFQNFRSCENDVFS